MAPDMPGPTHPPGNSPSPHFGTPEGPGTQLGPYRLIETIGEGGFGTVFRAEQTHPVKREVALKIIKLGMDTREVVARFEAERQALALMDYPAIAKVYDAGATEMGRPYFVMELVEGEPLTDYCEKNVLTTRERLELFGDVCLAVQHAHQKGVLHRDLKPSNVLVTEVNGVPLPKVIDFGIAKAIEQPLTEATLATEEFQVMGTPEYMSPEQATGRDVDTRADVYALGVLLYEILTGSRPFSTQSTGLDQLAELLRQIHEVTPAKPSTRVSQLGKASSGEASDTRILSRALRGDLDWIVMKALEKDRERRYASAAEMADDVGRHLANEPVLASPPSRIYRMRKFVRRNRLAVGSAVVLSLTLIVATIGLAMLYLRSVASEELAKREAETSRQALQFMTGMFEVSDPSQARGQTITAREVLDRGAERITRELADQPRIRAELMQTMGEVYRGLGLFDRAEELASSAEATRTELLGETHPETLRASALLADVWNKQAHLDRAEKLARKTLETQRSTLGPEHVDTLGSLIVLSQVLERQSKLEEAEALTREAVEAAQRTLGDDHALTLLAQDQLGVTFIATGRYEEAKELYQNVLATHRRTFGDDHPDTLLMIVKLAEVEMERGRFDEAEKLYLEALEDERRVHGEEHRDYLTTRQQLSLLYFRQTRLDEALELSREITATMRRVLGDGHLDTLHSINTLGVIVAGLGRYEEAEELYLEAHDGFRKLLGDESDPPLMVQGNLAILYLNTGQLEQAEDWARRAHEGSVELLGEDHPVTITRLENLSNVYYKQGDVDGALEVLEQVLEIRRDSLGDEHPAVTRTLVNLSIVLEDFGDLDGARAVREELLERTLVGLGFDYASVAEEIEKLALERFKVGDFEGAAECNAEVLRIRMETLGLEDTTTLNTMLDHLEIAKLTGRWEEVAPLCQEYYEGHARVRGEGHPNTLLCLRRIIAGYESVGDEGQAEEWRTRLAKVGG